MAVLLKECRDVQLRCGSVARYHDDELVTGSAVPLDAEFNAENIISDRLVYVCLIIRSMQIPTLIENKVLMGVEFITCAVDLQGYKWIS